MIALRKMRQSDSISSAGPGGPYASVSFGTDPFLSRRLCGAAGREILLMRCASIINAIYIDKLAYRQSYVKRKAGISREMEHFFGKMAEGEKMKTEERPKMIFKAITPQNRPQKS